LTDLTPTPFAAFSLPGTPAAPNLTGGQASTSFKGGPLALVVSGNSLGQGSSTSKALGPALAPNSIRVAIGNWPIGSYTVKVCCRTDVTPLSPVPVPLQVQVMVNWVQVASSNLYAASDTAVAAYPTAYANYAALCSFSLTQPSDVAVRVVNPGSYHAAGKHLWIRAVQLHRTS